MKKTIDNIAVTMVVFLFIVEMILVVRYYMISHGKQNIIHQISEQEKIATKEKSSDYLKKLESYNDIDVKVDPTKESYKNTVKVVSQLTKDELDNALKADEKKHYLKSIEGYTNKQKSNIKTESLEDVSAPDVVKNQDHISDVLNSIIGG